MLDDIIELIVEIGGEVIGAFAEHVSDQKKRSSAKKRKDAKSEDPWERSEEKPGWEE